MKNRIAMIPCMQTIMKNTMLRTPSWAYYMYS